MAREGLPQLVIDTFEHCYERLRKGDTGYILESEIEPIAATDLASLDTLSEYGERGASALEHTAIVKLNGGLGTTMGLDGPKCLLKIRGERNFLDLIHGRQAHQSVSTGRPVPVLYMNSFSTEEQTLAYLKGINVGPSPLPLSFVQHKYPKVLTNTLEPASWPRNPKLEWNPPGHGNIYTALVATGILRSMLERGIRYLFVSNVDNLGASLDVCLLGYFASRAIPFLMEVVDRTEMDKKGGHLARKSGGLVLRELAQAAREDLDAFQDVRRHRYFNSNNLWLNLEHFDAVVRRTGGVLHLPMIMNEKHLDPRDKTSPRVYQLETAMGAAINLFEHAEAVSVPRIRFSPVKRCEELLVAWSDYYVLGDDCRASLNPARSLGPIDVRLDPDYYATYDQMADRFPSRALSLVDCGSLTIKGDVRFGAGVVLHGDVRIVNRLGRQAEVADNSVVEGEKVFG
jgi:UTP--glucose-1-phosphate uridylyltransferase